MNLLNLNIRNLIKKNAGLRFLYLSSSYIQSVIDTDDWLDLVVMNYMSASWRVLFMWLDVVKWSSL